MNETFIQPKIMGYRQLTEEDAALINEIKAKGEELSQLIEKLRGTAADERWVNIGMTHLQQGIMCLVRGVAQPTTF